MRGGAIPILVWGTILLVLCLGNWVWNGRLVGSGAATAAVLIVYAFGVMLWLARREAIRRGPPSPREDPEAVPEASLAAVLIGLSVGCALFGLAWSNFLLYFGAGMLVLSVGRLAVELRSERATRRQVLAETRRQALAETERRALTERERRAVTERERRAVTERERR